MFMLRRTALRFVACPSTSFVAKSRSISNISHSAFKASRQSAVPLYQRRWASDEAEDKETPPIEKTEPAPEEVEENLEQTGSTTAETSEAQNVVDSAASVASEAASDAVEAVKETAEDLTSTQTPASEDEAKSTVYVGNLFFDVNDHDLQTEFSRFGEVESVNIIRDGRGLSKGFGYITYKAPEHASKAKDTMNQAVYEGRRISVQYAVRSGPRARSSTPLNPPTKTLFIGNMSFEMTDRDLNALFKGIRNVIDVRVAIDRRTGQPRGFAHADFIDVKSAVDAQKILQGKETYGRRLRVDFSQSSGGGRPERGEQSSE